jgi:acyl-coenzyme A thioesterase PaaI-like protein
LVSGRVPVYSHGNMKLAVTRKQPNSKMCVVCGLKNPHSLSASFYELENGDLATIVTARDEHQSYPGRLHGGLITALLDETIGRSIMTRYEDGQIWGVTVEFSTRFLKPVPLDTELRVVGRITTEDARYFEGSGEILLPNGGVAATATGRYMKLPISKIADFDAEEQEWRVVPSSADPSEVEVGGE